LSEPLIKDDFNDKSMIKNIGRDNFLLIKGEMAKPKGDFHFRVGLCSLA